MSIGIRRSASPLPRATATTATITVSGRLMANTIGFMAQTLFGAGRGGSNRSGSSCFGSIVRPLRGMAWLTERSL